MGMENLPVVFEPIIRWALIGGILIVVCIAAIVILWK